MVESPSMPKVTFALITYNQEQYVAEALNGALAQDYRPLELIVSDDCSRDSTVEVINRTLRSYRGDIEVRLNVNPVNLGLGGHVNRIVGLAAGELIVMGAGDDVSLPIRVSCLVEEWLRAGKFAGSLVSPTIALDGAGNELGVFDHPLPTNLNDREWLAWNWFPLIGAAHAFSREVFERFGPLLPDITYEDAAIAFRSAMLGGIRKHPKPLVRYRRNAGLSRPVSGISVESRLFEEYSRINSRMLWVYRQRYQDLLRIQASDTVLELVQKRIAQYEFLLGLSNKEPISFSSLLDYDKFGASPWWLFKNILRFKFPRAYGRWLRSKGII